MDLVFDNVHTVAFHAAYAIEGAYMLEKNRFLEYAERFIRDYPLVTDPSALRHYTKIMSDLLAAKLISPNETEVDDIIEKSFDLLISEKVKPAVKVWSMEILYLLSDRRGWVTGALDETLHNITETGTGTAAILNRAGRILKKLSM